MDTGFDTGGGAGGFGGIVGIYGAVRGVQQGGLIQSLSAGGHGAMAARGLAQVSQLLQLAGLRGQQQAIVYNAAQQQAAQIPAVQKPTIIQQLPAAAAKIAVAVQQILQARRQGRQARLQQHQAAQMQRQIAHILARSAPQYAVTAQYGPNLGPMIPGSADYLATYGGLA